MRLLSSPVRLFRTVAVAEAVTWALLLLGMVLKYVTRTTEVGVQVFGMVHGVVFIAYVLTTLVVWVDQGWGARRGLLGLAAAVPPFATVLFDRATERSSHLAPTWRLAAPAAVPATSTPERGVAVLLAHPARAGVAGVGAVVVLTLLVLAVGPPF